ncbi:MAG: hypothetical protein JKX84_01505, partial [Flavobacteriales bacterium]|nr:hypothetical protein [Flavobacteriales bacterium]
AVAESPVEKKELETVTEEISNGNSEPMIAEEKAPEVVSDKNILAGKLNQKPLEDLRTGIPLNEKFGMIRNLFSGNASDFGDAVLKLNNAASSEEMAHYLGLLKQRFSWDAESESYIAFAGYVERRMMTVVS